MDLTCANDDLAGPLRVLTVRLYARFRARGCDAGAAAEQAAQVAAQSLGCPLERARSAAAAVVADRGAGRLAG